MDDTPEALRLQAPDYAATIMQIITGTVGGPAGAFFGAMIGQWMPGLLQERLVKYVASLKAHLSELQIDFDDLGERMTAVEIDLFNLGAQVAGKSSTERIEQIAAVVAEGMSAADSKAADAERMVRLLADVSEDDVAALCALAPSYHMADKWRARHPRAAQVYQRYAPGLVGPGPVLDPLTATQEEQEQHVMLNFQLGRLQMLGLLDRKLGSVPYGGKPPTLGRYQLTDLAGVVLLKLGLAIPRDPDDRLRPMQPWEKAEEA